MIGNKKGSFTRFAPEENRLRVGNERFDDASILAHELKHAYNREFGLSDLRFNEVGVPNEEIDATNFQNIYHAAKGQALRTTYAGRNIQSALIDIQIYFNFGRNR